MTTSDDALDSRARRRTAIRVPRRTNKTSKSRKPRKRAILLPRQGKLTKMIEVLEHLAREHPLTEIARAVNLDPNIVSYHRTNARLLGLLDLQERITPEGHALLLLAPELRLGRLYYAFEASEVGRCWLAWAGLKTLDSLSPTTAEAFLRHLCGDDDYNTTLQAHEQALRGWCEDLKRAHNQLHLPSKARQPDLGPPPAAIVFDRGGSRDIVRALAATSSRVSVATGYFNIGGYRQLADNFHHADLRLLIGRDDPSRDQIKELLRHFRRSIDQDLRMRTAERRAAVAEFHITTIRGHIRIRSLEAREKGDLHAKVYLFDQEAAFVTSANLTGGAFFKNIEAGAVIREKPKVEYLQHCFDDLFDEAIPIEEPILREIERSSILLELQDPQLVFLKILLELFGSVDELDAEQRMHLAEYQKAIVSAVLTRLQAQRGLLLVAPTGIGKTVMTAYAAKVLIERGHVARVILVCKNDGMRDNWERTLRRFQIVPEVVRVFDLERTSLNPRVTSQTDEDLLESFRDLRPNDLVIVDECHHFRNRFAARSRTLRTFLIGPDGPGSRPYTLLLTATPMSTGIENINAQIELIGDEELSTVQDLACSQYALSVPLGSILQWFGDKGKNKHRALQHGDEHLYFPTLVTSIKRYSSALTPIFEALLKYRGVLSDVVLDQAELHKLTDEAAVDENFGGLSSGFLITLIARLAESSPAALTTCIHRLLSRAEKGELPAQDSVAVTQALRHLRHLAPTRSQDTKLTAVFQIIDRTDNREKILVFSEFVATIEDLHECLRERYKDRRVASLTGRMKPEERRTILRRFAPEAQRVQRPPAAQELDILVASDAISEGENLQDARIVINFDLPWTPLRLIQRVGRVDRFSRSPRSIRVHNLFPREDEYERVVKLWERLSSRDTENAAISGYPNVAEHERNPEHLAAGTPSQWLHEITVPDFDLADLRARASNTFPHARLLDLLWAAAEHHEAARALPDGVQAAAYGVSGGLYVLLRIEEKQIALFRPEGSERIEEAPTHYPHEYLLHRLAAHGPLKPVRGHGNLDDEIDALLDCRFSGARPDECQVVAALKLVSFKGAPTPSTPATPARPPRLRQLKLGE